MAGKIGKPVPAIPSPGILPTFLEITWAFNFTGAGAMSVPSAVPPQMTAATLGLSPAARPSLIIIRLRSIPHLNHLLVITVIVILPLKNQHHPVATLQPIYKPTPLQQHLQFWIGALCQLQ